MQPKIKESWININKLTMYNKDKTAKIVWGIRAGYPRLTMFTNLEDGLGRKQDYNNIIIAPFTASGILMFLHTFKKLIDAKEETKYGIDCINVKWEDGKKTDKKYIQAHIDIGRDNEGLYYISVEAEDRPTGIFYFMPDEWFRFYKDGAVIESKSILSHLVFKTYYLYLNEIMKRYIIEDELESRRKMISKPASSDIPF